MKIKNSHLVITGVILLFIYILSFSSLFNFDRRKKISTALLNPKYRNSVNQIELSSDGNSVLLTKNDDFWLFDGKIPASSSFINKFLDSLSSVTEVYRLSDKASSNNDYGFEKNAFTIRCFYEGKENLYIFGKEDFSRSFRYLKTYDSPQVFQISSYLEEFLSLSPQLWQDMEIISKDLLKNLSEKDLQRLIFTDFTSSKIRLKALSPADSDFSSRSASILSLRHAGSFEGDSASFSQKLFELQLEFGNRSQLLLSAFDQKSDDEKNKGFVLLKVYYKDKDFTSNLKISRWTMEKLCF